MTTQEKNGITEGVIWKQLLIFFFPILVGSFFQQLYNTVDSVIVGQFVGKEALSSVGGSAGQIISLVVGFFTGVSTGATVIISQYFGAGKKEEIEESLHTAYAFALVGGLVLGIAGIVFAPQMLRWMNTPEELIAESVLYVRVYFSGLIFIFIYNMGAAILRAVGDSKRPLYYLIVCSVVNIILDLLLILVIPLGVLGAAIATLVSYLMCFGIRAVSARRLIPFRLYPGRLAVSTGLLLLQSALCFWGSPVQPFAQMGAFVLLVTVNHKPIFEMLEQVLRIIRRRA